MQQMLTQLKLARIREIHQEWFDRAAETQMPYPDFLRGLLQEELLAREENQLRRRLKDAGFPFEKTLDDFDFRLRPELNRQVFLRYLDERFITQGRALVLVGPTGLGKTHLSVAVGLALLKRGYTVRFTTVQALLTRVLRAPGLDGRARVLKPYHASDVPDGSAAPDVVCRAPARPPVGRRPLPQSPRPPPDSLRRPLHPRQACGPSAGGDPDPGQEAGASAQPSTQHS